MGAPSYARGTPRRRKGPSPNSILDRQALEDALERAGLDIKKIHIDGFYQALHRQHYPELRDFIHTYYLNEDKPPATTTTTSHFPELPLKNKVSRKKNLNRIKIPQRFLQFLQDTNEFVTLTTRVHQAQTSQDGTTTKLAVELHDGHRVESVLMRIQSEHGGSRASLCVSSQVGCAMKCTFCATGTMGLYGNLTAGEILEQLVHADRILAQEWFHNNNNSSQDENQSPQTGNQRRKFEFVRNVVFMGMGEPLDNYSQVLNAARAMMDRKRWNLGHGKVTISTVGLVSQMRKLTRDIPQASLALSLHAPTQEMRQQIVPTATRYPIQDLIQALDEHMMASSTPSTENQNERRQNGSTINYSSFTKEERIQASTRRRAMIEYVMLDGKPTSSFHAAHELGKLCQDRQLIVNLIPYNPTDVEDVLQCPTREHMEEFRRIVSSYGAFCTIRRTMGADIDSACGQLVQQNADKKNNATMTDIEDIMGQAKESLSTTKPIAPIKTTRTNRRVLANDAGENKDEATPVQEISARNSNRIDLEGFIRPLQIATFIAATCFLVSSSLYVGQRHRNK